MKHITDIPEFINQIKFEFDETNNTITCSSTHDEYIEIDCFLHDYTTKLGFFSYWFGLNTNQYCTVQLPNEILDKPYFSGYIFKIYFGNQFLFEKLFPIKNPTIESSFSTRDGSLSFLSWVSLVYEDEYKTDMCEDDVVYDLGANYGVYSMFANRFNVKQIYAFEPTPDVFDCLKRTFKNNKNISIFDKAISSEDKVSPFYTHKSSVSNGLIKGFLDRWNTELNTVDVECVNLENFILNNSLLPPTIIKCDIEGSEYDFIKSLSDSFFMSIRVFIVEFHYNTDSQLFEIISKLLNQGFSIEMCVGSKTTMHTGTIIAKRQL
jgi:FkbM family methyltransferase